MQRFYVTILRRGVLNSLSNKIFKPSLHLFLKRKLELKSKHETDTQEFQTQVSMHAYWRM